VTGPERHTRRIARGAPWINPRKLAKLAGARVEVDGRILDEAQAEREAGGVSELVGRFDVHGPAAVRHINRADDLPCAFHPVQALQGYDLAFLVGDADGLVLVRRDLDVVAVFVGEEEVILLHGASQFTAAVPAFRLFGRKGGPWRFRLREIDARLEGWQVGTAGGRTRA
jgi:hypothetical protein